MLLGLQVTFQTLSSSERELISQGEASVPLGVNGTTGSLIRTSDFPIARLTPYPLGRRIGGHISVSGVTNAPILGHQIQIRFSGACFAYYLFYSSMYRLYC